jgi:hypothetical protein
MPIRWFVAILYAAVILIGFVVIAERQPVSEGLVALRAIEAGEMMRDIAPGNGARYAKRKIAAGEILKPSDFVALPIVAAPEATFVTAVAVDRALVDAGDLNGGKLAQLCAGAVTETVPVQSVLCGPAGSTCIAFAAVPVDKVSSLGDALKDKTVKARLLRANSPC